MIPLPQVNLTGATVGTKAQISLLNAGVGAGGSTANPAFTKLLPKIQIFNESGYGLLLSFAASSKGVNLPAGAWITLDVPLGESSINLTVLYVLALPQVSLVLANYYFPDERTPELVTLGNSPMTGAGLGGSVSTLSNEGNPINTTVIDIGPTGSASAITIKNDRFTWDVVQAGVTHRVLEGQISGNPLKIGQLSDVSEVLGELQINSGLIRKSSTQPVLASTANDLFLAAENGKFIFQSPVGTNKWSLDRMSFFTGTGTVLATHGLGATPDTVLIQYAGNFGSPPDHPAYFHTPGATQVTIVADAGYFWHAVALKF